MFMFHVRNIAATKKILHGFCIKNLNPTDLYTVYDFLILFQFHQTLLRDQATKLLSKEQKSYLTVQQLGTLILTCHGLRMERLWQKATL